MINKRHIVIDLETLDVSPTSVILQLAACEFDINDNGKILRELLVNVDRKEQLLNRTSNSDTIEWWSKQDPEKQAFMLENVYSLESALYQLSEWLPADTQTYKIWANSPNFDMSILENAYGYQFPWKYWQYMDVRTIKELAISLQIPIPEADKTQKHSALYDCYYEAYLVSFIVSHLKQGYLYG